VVGVPVGYVIAVYNDMAKALDPGGGETLLIDLAAFIPPRAQTAPARVAYTTPRQRHEGNSGLLAEENGKPRR
jgi:hypothetical protein